MTNITAKPAKTETRVVEKTVQVEEEVVIQEFQSAAEQVLALPQGSIVAITAGRTGMDTILHRTGLTGWLSTRPLPVFKNEGRVYYNTDHVREALRKHEAAGATFTLIHSFKG